MRLVFGPNDDEAFAAAREELLGRFERWLVAEGLGGDDPAGVAGDAGLALDWKWGYGGGQLARWRTGDITEFLLEWCPRKLSASPADAMTIPGALAAFVEFLDDELLLAKGSSAIPALAGAVAGATDDFMAAIVVHGRVMATKRGLAVDAIPGREFRSGGQRSAPGSPTSFSASCTTTSRPWRLTTPRSSIPFD
jgi:hypothetical protein